VNGHEEVEVGGGYAEGAAANQIKVRVDEVARKVQGFHIAQEDGSQY
jgi:serine-threonine kinase receptor-associated protein